MRLENDFQASKQSLSKEICERQQVLSELTSTLKQVDKVNEQLTKSNKRLSSEVVAQGNSKKRRLLLYPVSSNGFVENRFSLTSSSPCYFWMVKELVRHQ